MKLLKFWAEWCQPCKQQSKWLEDFKDVPIVEYNVEEDASVTNEYNIISLPTMILTDDEGNELHRFNGLTSIDKIREYLQ